MASAGLAPCKQVKNETKASVKYITLLTNPFHSEWASNAQINIYQSTPTNGAQVKQIANLELKTSKVPSFKHLTVGVSLYKDNLYVNLYVMPIFDVWNHV